MENFNELNLPEALVQSLTKMQFKTPTPIQAQAIPRALRGRDILGSAQTGTGKTGAFAIPMVAHLMNNENSAALIMTPTRELAAQVMQMVKKLLGPNSPIRTAQLIGGENMFRQFAQLQDDPRIIIGTPGRINDHLARKSLDLSNVDFLVLDETDRMLDMGFGVQIDKILTYMPQERQTLMFSATLPSNIVRMADRYTKNAERIAVGSTTAPAVKIKQEVIHVGQPQKYDVLTQELDARSGSIIVFVRTKHGCDRIARKLERENHSAEAIHGDLRQNKRDKVIRLFREKKIRILIATDVAARGLDVPHIEHVINFDLPQSPEDYIHRIGRTARAGAEGEALCLISPEEGGKWAAIERLMSGKASDEPEQRGRGGNRSRNKSGFGRKNESGYKSGGKREGGFKQDRARKPHRKGQSWQVAHDERKAREAASSNQAAEQKYERKFEKRDQKSFRNDRNDRPAKPWQKRERHHDESRAPRSDKPWQKRGRVEEGNDRLYQKRDRAEGGFDKPWQKRSEGSENRSTRGDKPWQKREGSSDRPYVKRERNNEGRSDRPYKHKREGGNDRPYQKRDHAEGGFEKKPWQKREGGSDRPFKKREGSSDRPFQKREGGKPAFKNGRKLAGKSISGTRSRFDADKPFKRRNNNAV